MLQIQCQLLILQRSTISLLLPSSSRIPISFPASLFHRSRFSSSALHHHPLSSSSSPPPPLLSSLRISSENMLPELQDFGFFRRLIIVTLFLAALLFSCFVLYRAAESAGFNMPTSYYTYYYTRNHPQMTTDLLPEDSLPLDREEYRLEKVLKEASMQDKTVILATINAAWAAPNSIIDLFLESFRIGEQTRKLMSHLVIVALDRKAFSRCLILHTHCFPLITEGVDFSDEAYFMTPEYLKMMWSRIKFLTSVLEMGYNFVFTDADVMWFRDPFPHFYFDADFQIACDHFSGQSDNVENRPNGGFNFVRSNSKSIEFYKYWYSAREVYPGLHDQDVLNRIKNDTFVFDIGLKMRFLSTSYFGGFCEPSEDLNEVCTMHANCCFGLDSKLHDLRILLEDWKRYMSLPPKSKFSSILSWRVPQNCSLDALRPSNSEEVFGPNNDDGRI